ncbi:MAG: cytochrome P450 [Pseudomonadota bacterium]
MADFALNLPVVEQDPSDPTFFRDPYRSYSNWRALGDFVFWADYDMPVATTHAAVSQTLRHPLMGRAVPDALNEPPNPALEAFRGLEKYSLLEIEPPDHTRLRREALKAFSGPQIALIAPRVSQFADQLISDFPAGPFDLIEAYSKPLAALTITSFLGADTGDAAKLQAWSNDMVAMYQARRNEAVEARAETASQAISAYMLGLVEERRRNLGNDFLSQLIGVQAIGGMSLPELISTSILLLNAGHEATVHAVGNAIPLLIDFDGRQDALGPDSIAGTVEECLRFRPPLHLFKRYVYKSATVEDTVFAPNDQIACLLASAGRDDALWPDGEVFDPFRPRLRHMAFGVGIHSCIGAALARLEMQIALPALFSRCPNLALHEAPQVAPLYHFHGYEQLMVTVK